MIDANVRMGRNVRIFNPDMVNLFDCEIGDDSFIGPFVEITRGVTIGKGCIIESHSFLCTGVMLEDNVFIGHGVMFVNDLYPMPNKKVEYLKTRVGRSASLGTNSTIVGGICIGRFAVVGAGAVVTCDVPDFSIAAGNPAKILKAFATQQDLEAYMLSRQPLRT
jgi:UDP-2-acetamido-3-amino-2,3-dideoxy-glucuronate N-acetyltransferase